MQTLFRNHLRNITEFMEEQLEELAVNVQVQNQSTFRGLDEHQRNPLNTRQVVLMIELIGCSQIPMVFDGETSPEANRGGMAVVCGRLTAPVVKLMTRSSMPQCPLSMRSLQLARPLYINQEESFYRLTVGPLQQVHHAPVTACECKPRPLRLDQAFNYGGGKRSVNYANESAQN